MARSEHGDNAAEGVGGELFELARSRSPGEGEGIFFPGGQPVDDELAKVSGEGVPLFREEGDNARVLQGCEGDQRFTFQCEI